MTDKIYLRNLRTPSRDNPLRILLSACLAGELCGVDGKGYGDYPSVIKLLKYDNVKLFSFCPEDYALGTPRETPDCIGGDGHDVLDGIAQVVTQSGVNITEEMIQGSKKMLQIAQENEIELAVMMDASGACGSQVIYNGTRFAENPKYQIGMGVSAAQLHRNGFKIISQRDYASLEILYSKLDPNHVIQKNAIDHDQNEWYLNYFKANKGT